MIGVFALQAPPLFAMGARHAALSLPRTDHIEDYRAVLVIRNLMPGTKRRVESLDMNVVDVGGLAIRDHRKAAEVQIALTGGESVDSIYAEGYGPLPHYFVTDETYPKLYVETEGQPPLALAEVVLGGSALPEQMTGVRLDLQATMDEGTHLPKIRAQFQSVKHEICGNAWPFGGWSCRTVSAALRTVVISKGDFSIRYRLQSNCQPDPKAYDVKSPLCSLMEDESIP